MREDASQRAPASVLAFVKGLRSVTSVDVILKVGEKILDEPRSDGLHCGQLIQIEGVVYMNNLGRGS